MIYYLNNYIEKGMRFYDNPHFANISRVLMDHYMIDAKSNALTNTKTYNLTGGSIRRQYEYIPKSFIETREAEGRKLILNATNVITPSNYNFGGRVNTHGGNMGKFFKPVISAGLDVLAPAAGMYLGGPVGATLAKGVREGVRAVTGYGKAKKGGKKAVGVGVYGGSMNASDTTVGGSMSAGCNGDMACLPCKKKMKGSAKTAGAKTAGAKTAGSRMDMVKKIMKEKNMKLGQASKYIKDNNLY